MNFDLVFGEDRTEQRPRNYTGDDNFMVLSKMHMPSIPFVDEEKDDPIFEVVCEMKDGSKKTCHPSAKSGDQARVAARRILGAAVKKIAACKELPKLSSRFHRDRH